MAKPTKSQEYVQLSVINPDTVTIVPSAVEKTYTSKQYVSWGADNTFPKELFDLYTSSSSLSAIINGTLEMIKEMFEEDAEIDDIQLFTDLCRDYMLYGCFAYQVIFDKLRRPIKKVHLPMQFVRLNEDKTTVFFSKKFSKYSGKAVEYPVWSKDMDFPEGYSCVYYYSNAGHLQTYGISPQSGCLIDLSSEYLSAMFTKSKLDTGLCARYVITLPHSANLNTEQRAAIERGIKEKFSGITASDFMVYYAAGDTKIGIDKLDLDHQAAVFKQIRETARENIFVTNFATPNLFGLPTATTGFSEQEYQQAFELYERMRITPTVKIVKAALADVKNNRLK